jgi:hypothetical protein
MKTIANVLGVARSHLHERVHRPTAARGSYCKAADEELLLLIRRMVDERPTLRLSARHRAGEQSAGRRGQAGG